MGIIKRIRKGGESKKKDGQEIRITGLNLILKKDSM